MKFIDGARYRRRATTLRPVMGCQLMWNSARLKPTLLISIERSGRTKDDTYLNMRDADITDQTARVDYLFEAGIPSVGIGDGGNEIGMGGIAWQDLRKAVAIGPAERIACRIATDWTLIAGVSNWAGYALAWSIAALKDSLRQDQTKWPASCDAENLGLLIQTLVRNSFCVDGVTKRPDVSVDSLPMESYLKTFTDLATLYGREP